MVATCITAMLNHSNTQQKYFWRHHRGKLLMSDYKFNRYNTYVHKK